MIFMSGEIMQIVDNPSPRAQINHLVSIISADDLAPFY